MALIHEKLYQYDNLSSINMREYIGQLSDFLAQTYRSDKEIKVIIDADDINLDIDVAVPLGLITNELLSNAWKYAFQGTDGGEIRINLQKTENGHQLEIQDTGRGIADDIDPFETKSLGLKLVRSLTRQIQGELQVVNQNPGTAFRVAFRELMVA
ncbi:MAG: sensor histidine kinase [Cyclobacteriaceae bacterium]